MKERCEFRVDEKYASLLFGPNEGTRLGDSVRKVVLPTEEMKLHGNLRALIPGLPAWNNGAGIDPESWIGCYARYDLAIGYALLFWPDFVIYDECIFIREPDKKIYASWMEQCKGDKTRVEGVMNHRHIVDMFLNSETKPTKDVVRHIGHLLKDMWSCRLKRDFPDRPIKVEFFDDDSDDLVGYELTVFQKR